MDLLAEGAFLRGERYGGPKEPWAKYRDLLKHERE
jgi:hypothetical protein